MADSFSDLTITGNGTASLRLTAAGLSGPSNTVTGADSITLTAEDFLFFG